MPSKRRLRVPDNQLPLIDMEQVPAVKKKTKQKCKGTNQRTEDLEQRVTHLEAEVTLITAQLERDEEEED